MENSEVTAAMSEFDEALGKLVLKTTNAERERCRLVVANVRRRACIPATAPSILDDCHLGIIQPEAEPTPPPTAPPGPMTVEKLLSKIWDHCNAKTGWSVNFKPLEADLLALVQAARDKGFEEGKSEQMEDKSPPAHAAELMTIETVMVKLRYNIASTPRFWGEVETWLTRLVREQARRDAETCLDVGCGRPSDAWADASKACAKAVRQSAGLE